jgi:sodium transport system permease protein
MRAWSVFTKEIIDALRDRRTWISVLLSSVLMGPLILVLINVLVSQLEERAEKRVVVIAGVQYAPQLRNWFERQTFEVQAAPADYEAQLKTSKLGDPVLVITPDFQDKLDKGEAPVVELVSDSSNRNSQVGSARVERALQAYVQEQGALTIATRGVPTAALKVIDVQPRDLASTQSRSAQVFSMIPFFVMMAVLYGALNAALDTSAGERERGSLEPLLMTPASRLSLVLGKWGAVAAVGMLIAVLSVLSFLPGQWLVSNDTLQALFQFGVNEGAAFLAVLLPFAAALAAVLMAVAIRCKTFKEAQANNTVVILAVSLLPLVGLVSDSGEKWWHLLLPGLGQQVVMTRVLKGEALMSNHIVLPALVCVVVTVLCVMYITRELRQAAVR